MEGTRSNRIGEINRRGGNNAKLDNHGVAAAANSNIHVL